MLANIGSDSIMYCSKFLSASDILALSRVNTEFHDICVSGTEKINSESELRDAIQDGRYFAVNFSKYAAYNVDLCLRFACEFNVPHIYSKIMIEYSEIARESLYYACRYINYDVVEFISTHEIPVDINRGYLGACESGSVDMYELLGDSKTVLYENQITLPPKEAEMICLTTRRLSYNQVSRYMIHAIDCGSYDLAVHIYTTATHHGSTTLSQTNLVAGFFRKGALEHIKQIAGTIPELHKFLGSTIAGGHIETLQYLLSQGVILNSPGMLWGLACSYKLGHFDMIAYVIQKVALCHRDLEYIAKVTGTDIDQIYQHFK